MFSDFLLVTRLLILRVIINYEFPQTHVTLNCCILSKYVCSNDFINNKYIYNMLLVSLHVAPRQGIAEKHCNGALNPFFIIESFSWLHSLQCVV